MMSEGKEKYDISINFLRYIYNIMLEGRKFDARELMFDGLAIMDSDLMELVEDYITSITIRRASKKHKDRDNTYFTQDIAILAKLRTIDVKEEIKKVCTDISGWCPAKDIGGDNFHIIRYRDARKFMSHKYARTFVISPFERRLGRLCIFFPFTRCIEDEKVGITDDEYIEVVRGYANIYSRIIFNATQINSPSVVKCNDMHMMIDRSPLAKRVAKLERELATLSTVMGIACETNGSMSDRKEKR